MIPDRVEFLLMLARDAQAEGDSLVAEQTRINAAHAQRLKDLWAMAEETRRILEREIRRFNAYLPRDQEQPAELNPQRTPLPPKSQQVTGPQQKADSGR
jgi:hypothetical protein